MKFSREFCEAWQAASSREEKAKLVDQMIHDMGGKKKFAEWFVDRMSDEELMDAYRRMKAH